MSLRAYLADFVHDWAVLALCVFAGLAVACLVAAFLEVPTPIRRLPCPCRCPATPTPLSTEADL